MHDVQPLSRVPLTCPKCGGPTYAASWRKPKTIKGEGTTGRYSAIGRSYCPTCDKLLPRKTTRKPGK